MRQRGGGTGGEGMLGGSDGGTGGGMGGEGGAFSTTTCQREAVSDAWRLAVVPSVPCAVVER